MQAVLVVNVGASRNGLTAGVSIPGHPHGGRYYLGGHEEIPQAPPLWTTGFNSESGNLCRLAVPSLRHGYFWTWRLEKETVGLNGDALRVIEILSEQIAVPEQEVLARLGGDQEQWRGVLARLAAAGFVERNNGRLRLAILVFTRGDSDVLTPKG